MQQQTGTRLILAGLCVLILFATVITVKVWTLDSRLTQAIERVTMQTVATEVTNGDGVKFTVVTTRIENETQAAWRIRHKDACDDFENS